MAAERSAGATAATRTLVLIDDDAGLTRVLAGFLGRAGYGVHCAGTARAGVELVGRLHPDLVLLDRLLPDGDGFDLLTQLKQDPATSATPVLVLSIRRERPLGMRLGASGYLVKPVAPENVLDAVRSCLGDRVAHSSRVLVVDDEPDTRRLLLERLALAGFEVSGAADGTAALESVRSLRPALVLLDLMMPGMDGWEVLRQLRAEPATVDLPVIVLTGRDLAEDRETGEELRVIDVMSKPFDLGHLVEEIEHALSEKHADSTPARTGSRPAVGSPPGGVA